MRTEVPLPAEAKGGRTLHTVIHQKNYEIFGIVLSMKGLAAERRVLPTHTNPLHDLDERERQLALFLAEGKSMTTATALAGYGPAGMGGRDRKKKVEDPRIIKAVNFLRKKSEESILTSRKKVLEGFLEAIEQAKMLSEPMTQIAGWREIGKLCGYYAPEVKEINVNIGAKRVIGQLEVLSDQELLDIIEKDREAIEGEATLLLSDPHNSEASEKHDGTPEAPA